MMSLVEVASIAAVEERDKTNHFSGGVRPIYTTALIDTS